MSESDTAPTELVLTRIDPPERKRTYVFSCGERLSFENVVGFAVRPSGTHRLELAGGRKVIVSAGFLAIELDIQSWSF